MKNILALAICLLAGSAFAADVDTSTSRAGPVQSQNVNKSTADANANNTGNSQNITFTSPPVTTSTVTQNISGTQTVNNNQTISGGTNSSVDEHVHGTQTIRNVPSVSGPNLVSSNDTCMGSASGSANVPGFGLSLGKTYTDSNCVMLKNSRELWNMGMKAAAMARMCMDAENREALEMTGFTCPQTLRARGQAYNSAGAIVTTTTVQAAPQPNSNEYTGNDPIVRRRLGLPVKE